MKYEDAILIAERVKAELEPHCERIEIAGSIRRKKPEVKDIEIVAIPKPYETGLVRKRDSDRGEPVAEGARRDALQVHPAHSSRRYQARPVLRGAGELGPDPGDPDRQRGIFPPGSCRPLGAARV